MLPKHAGLNDFANAFVRLRGAFTALRSSCSWGLLLLDGTAAVGSGDGDGADGGVAARAALQPISIANASVADLVLRRIVRGPPDSREKYFLNVSAVKALGIKHVNIHGIYSHQDHGPNAA